MKNIIFGDDGEQYIITNLEDYLTLQLDEDIVKTFETNLYYHYLNLLLEDLVNKKFLIREGEPYNSDDLELTISIIKNFMVENYGFTPKMFSESETKIKNLLPKNGKH